MDIAWNLFFLIALGAMLGSLLGFLGRLWWIFDLFSHFRAQYCALCALLAVLWFAAEKYPQGIACLAFALFNLGWIVPVYRKAPPHYQKALAERVRGNPGSSEPHVYRALLANVLQQNRQYPRVEKLIRSSDPDLILLIEINGAWVEKLQPALANYPHALLALREDNYGLGLFSKLPFACARTAEFGQVKIPSLLAYLELNGQTLLIVGTHPPPPKRAAMAGQRDAQLRDIARFIARQPGPAMLMGDLNLTPWSPHFHDILRLGQLKDSRQGWGLHPTWPIDRLPFLVPIDHILVTEGIAVHRRWRGPFTGSDHLPVLMEFSLYPSPPTG